ncbi:unnamed protein product (macronuclear) [Paramecium tetraurelia]|uniref:Uncharacterized protein n=1 Tax=Paramecium tetraurelia TaxID=5888 RepID=A0BTJ9_PARTE|nr:uncharacterized protein GSPATT00032098001 [Paramecium tetraurelia]CAK61866.1 unnamed protein product [Paramecium tetraurelia]|eukprot:XP_001429264.1 hypothetical protein (macronuclear) [Paramecium tetraurelia strain d4-2]
MMRLNITRLTKRMNMKPPSENDFSTLLIAKNTPIRQLSISTRSSKNSQIVRRLPTNHNQQSQQLTSRTISVHDTHFHSEPLKEKQISVNTIQNKKNSSRRLIGLQTQPSLIIKPKFADIKYEMIDIYQLNIAQPKILYKGNRDTTHLQRIAIIGESVSLNRQLIQKIKSECILVLLTNNLSQINDQYDCIMQPPRIHPNDVLSYQRNVNQIWINVNHLIHTFKQPEQIIMIEEVVNENNTFSLEDLKNKILYAGNCKMIHLFLQKAKPNLQKLYYVLCHIFKYEQQDLIQLNLKRILQECSENCLQIQSKLTYLQKVVDIKKKCKQQFKKEQMPIESPEDRAENLRDCVIEYIKSRTTNKITGMYFIVGDQIMRNIQFFRNRQEDKYFTEKKHQEALQILQNTLQPTKHAHICSQQYAFYLL